VLVVVLFRMQLPCRRSCRLAAELSRPGVRRVARVLSTMFLVGSGGFGREVDGGWFGWVGAHPLGRLGSSNEENFDDVL
jgi:hypothetical protein